MPRVQLWLAFKRIQRLPKRNQFWASNTIVSSGVWQRFLNHVIQKRCFFPRSLNKGCLLSSKTPLVWYWLMNWLIDGWIKYSFYHPIREHFIHKETSSLSVKNCKRWLLLGEDGRCLSCLMWCDTSFRLLVCVTNYSCICISPKAQIIVWQRWIISIIVLYSIFICIASLIFVEKCKISGQVQYDHDYNLTTALNHNSIKWFIYCRCGKSLTKNSFFLSWTYHRRVYWDWMWIVHLNR